MPEFGRPQRDDNGTGFIKANFDIRDVRLMYEGLSFYLQNENQEPDDYDRIMKIKNSFYAMLLEHQYRTWYGV